LQNLDITLALFTCIPYSFVIDVAIFSSSFPKATFTTSVLSPSAIISELLFKISVIYLFLKKDSIIYI